MNRCEDFPCCGHGPPPMGDGGGCPDSEGRFNCVECGKKLARDAPSAICSRCRRSRQRRYEYDAGGDFDYSMNY